jgi:FAD:protein FMN transferase
VTSVIFTCASVALCANTFLGGDTLRRVHRTSALMGTTATISVAAQSRLDALAMSETAMRTMEELESVLSSWQPASELSALNAAPVGSEAHPSSGLGALLAEAASWVRLTDGAFEPVVGALIDAWDLRGGGREPTRSELRAALEAVGPRGMHIDPESGVVRRLVDAAWIDAGAFGKGAALRSARDTLRARGTPSAILDLGGQLLYMGEDDHDIPVAHPARRDASAAVLRVRNVSVATSGVSERFIDVGGEQYGHILDPRTGLPVPAWGSVTVVAEDPLEADIVSTALYVMGAEAGLRWARNRGTVAALFLMYSGGSLHASWTPAMKPWLLQVPESKPPKEATRCTTICNHFNEGRRINASHR